MKTYDSKEHSPILDPNILCHMHTCKKPYSYGDEYKTDFHPGYPKNHRPVVVRHLPEPETSNLLLRKTVQRLTKGVDIHSPGPCSSTYPSGPICTLQGRLNLFLHAAK